MKTINIFIAGAKELAPQRTKLKALLSDLNHRLQRSSGIRLSVASYETYGNDQNDYDAFITNEADLLMLILQDRIGQKTEDEYLLAVDKPAGMLIHPSRSRNTGTLANLVVGYYQKTGKPCAFHPMTRLDRDTFGIVLLAKNAHVHTLLQQSDIVSLHARSNGAIMTDREFGLMKQNSYLINSARSYLVDTQAFKRAMDSGKLLGAAIDVFETEPDIPEFYRTYDNITLTNHLGGITINSFRDAPKFSINNYLNYVNGGELAFWANKQQLAK